MHTIWCQVLSGCIAAGRRLAAYITHVPNIDSDPAARAITYVDDGIVKMS